jgi:hypothetical protein
MAVSSRKLLTCISPILPPRPLLASATRLYRYYVPTPSPPIGRPSPAYQPAAIPPSRKPSNGHNFHSHPSPSSLLSQTSSSPPINFHNPKTEPSSPIEVDIPQYAIPLHHEGCHFPAQVLPPRALSLPPSTDIVSRHISEGSTR